MRPVSEWVSMANSTAQWSCQILPNHCTTLVLESWVDGSTKKQTMIGRYHQPKAKNVKTQLLDEFRYSQRNCPSISIWPTAEFDSGHCLFARLSCGHGVQVTPRPQTISSVVDWFGWWFFWNGSSAFPGQLLKLTAPWTEFFRSRCLKQPYLTPWEAQQKRVGSLPRHKWFIIHHPSPPNHTISTATNPITSGTSTSRYYQLPLHCQGAEEANRRSRAAFAWGGKPTELSNG